MSAFDFYLGQGFVELGLDLTFLSHYEEVPLVDSLQLIRKTLILILEGFVFILKGLPFMLHGFKQLRLILLLLGQLPSSCFQHLLVFGPQQSLIVSVLDDLLIIFGLGVFVEGHLDQAVEQIDGVFCLADVFDVVHENLDVAGVDLFLLLQLLDLVVPLHLDQLENAL